MASPSPPAGPFVGFGRELNAFFAELAAAQSRDWFHANRDRYDRAVAVPMAALVTSLTLAFAARDIPLQGTPKTSIFRINRDIRFSKDKSPYKTHASAVLSRDGMKQSFGVLYVHVGLDEAFVAMGFYAPEPGALTALRDAIAAEPDRFARITARLAKSDLILPRDQMAARVPRGYDAAERADVADWLRMRSYTVSRRLLPQEAMRPQFIDAIVKFSIAGLPLLQFGWDALTESRTAECR